MNADEERATTRVSVIDIDMPFGSMVRLMVKWAIAAIPAMLILLFIAVGCGLLVGMLAGGARRLLFGAPRLPTVARPASAPAVTVDEPPAIDTAAAEALAERLNRWEAATATTPPQTAQVDEWATTTTADSTAPHEGAAASPPAEKPAENKPLATDPRNPQNLPRGVLSVQVYIDPATKLYYAEQDCIRPQRAVKLPKAIAIGRGFQPAPDCYRAVP